MAILQNRYQVVRRLSSKPGRQTLLAKDLTTQSSVVIKVMLFDENFQWTSLKLFEREAETLKALNHPAIPRYVDYFELDVSGKKGFALVQSYIASKSLEEHVKAGRTFSESELTELAKALLEILVYLHGRIPPVIHRDIKPSNILLSTRTDKQIGSVYLVDFGAVQTAPNINNTYTVVGTYGYMPPEQFGGLSTPASDLYSFGATLIYVVTGKHPADLTTTNLKIQFKPLTSLNPVLIDFLHWLTEPSVEQRPSTAQIALDRLNKRQRRPRQNKLSAGEIFWNAGWRSFLILMLVDLAINFTTYIELNSFLPNETIGSTFLRIILSLGTACFLLAISMGLVFYVLTQRFASSQSSNFKTYRQQLAIASVVTYVIVSTVFDLFTSVTLYASNPLASPFHSFSSSILYLSFLSFRGLSMVWMSALFADWYEKRRTRTT